MLTAREAVEYLNFNEKIIYRLVSEGRLPGTRITAKWYDLIVPQGNLSMEPVRIFFNLLHSRKFLREARALPGYNLKDSGKILQ